jgi:hypothetical protein
MNNLNITYDINSDINIEDNIYENITNNENNIQTYNYTLLEFGGTNDNSNIYYIDDYDYDFNWSLSDLD